MILKLEEIVDDMLLDWLENNAWDQLSDYQLSQFNDEDPDEDYHGVVHQWFAEYKGWA